MEEQLSVFREIRDLFKIDIVPVVNKADLLGQESARRCLA
jgi:GTP1/Obg family GTP-binding protein